MGLAIRISKRGAALQYIYQKKAAILDHIKNQKIIKRNKNKKNRNLKKRFFYVLFFAFFYCNLEISINNASRRSEATKCQKKYWKN